MYAAHHDTSRLCPNKVNGALRGGGKMTRSAQSVPDVPLDRTSPVPLYFQVATRLQQLIEDGELPVGSRLENEVELADRLGVSRPTMRRARRCA